MTNDDAEVRPGEQRVPIVGVGASAGGLPALVALVQGIPPETEACYVIVQHFSPDQASILHQLLQPHTPVPVTEASDCDAPQPGTILVVPPGRDVTLKDERIRLRPRSDGPGLHRPIDGLFSALADAWGRDAFCVVLSGTGSDGSDGLVKVKAAGGYALVQDSAGARFPGMPDSARATGLVDFVLPARELAGRVEAIARYRREQAGETTRMALRAEIEKALPRIAERLTAVSGNDFGAYKPGTLVRRIERRLTLLRIDDVADFVSLLTSDEEQARVLAQEFLIGVTEFFRDEDAFATLRRVAVDPIVARAGGHIRVWVPGCSTGEEAYSVAMLFLEAIEARDSRAQLQVFGTDIDVPALVTARKGIYPPAAIERIAPERRKRFFTQEAGEFRAVQALRDVCVFAPHNLVQDPPFSRIDLISCRNLLIYLSSGLQRRITPKLHFALRGEGVVFLGPSETLPGDDLFKPLDAVHRIFRRNDAAAQRYSALDEAVATTRRGRGWLPPLSPEGSGRPMPEPEIRAERAFLRKRAAPFAMITSAGEIVYLSHRMGAYVRPTAGAPSNLIDALLRPELRVPVRAALDEAASEDREVTVRDIAVGIDAESAEGAEGDAGPPPAFLDIHVSPMADSASDFLVTLSPVRAVGGDRIGAAVKARRVADEDSLEAENFNLRRQLAATLHEFDNSGQELRSSNEELLSMNEELQSSNEELQTSREELQSINEELQTVNAELQENNRQLVRANSDLKNLFESTDIAVLFLDRNFCVRNFTPSTAALFGIRDRDVGRPIFDLSSRIDLTDLRADAAEVNRTLQPSEREVVIPATGSAFIMRVKPYRTIENVIDGYAVSFIDITARRTYEETLRGNQEVLALQYAELENLYDTVPVGLALHAPDLKWLRINDQLARINGFPIGDHVGANLEALIPDIDPKIQDPIRQVFATGEAIRNAEVEGVTPGTGEARNYLVDYYPVYSDNAVAAVGTCVRDVTDEVRLRDDLRRSLAMAEESEAKLARIFDAAPVLVALHEGADHVYIYNNPRHAASLNGRAVLGKPLREAVPELVGTEIAERFDHVFRTGEPAKVEEVNDSILPGVDNPRTYSFAIQPWFGPEGDVAGVMTFAFDITDEKRAVEEKSFLLAELQHRVKNTLATIIAVSRFILRDTDTAEGYQERLIQRLRGMARTHDLLTDRGWHSVELAELVEAELAPFAADRGASYVLIGDSLTLSPREALSLNLALHELTTNALKYGALSRPEGRVEIVAERVEDPDGGPATRRIRWIERGGPPIAAPAENEGFGSIVLKTVVARDLNGRVELDYDEAGLTCEVVYVET